MLRYFNLALFAIIFYSISFAQNKDVFEPRSPIGHPIILSGSFGELRSNHFHSGIDIKSSKWHKTGDKIYAIEDGFISRIKVSGDGYGKALYIDHPGGYTSVYGHMESFSDPIAAFVKENQYKLRSFSINLHPDTIQFKVKKGELIGTMGNTGRSYAPHLHFEIRHTVSEKPLNPLWFGIGSSDERPPIISSVKIAHLSPDTTQIDMDVFKSKYRKKGIFRLEKDTLTINAWRVGIEMSGFDRMNGASNKTGIYELIMKLNGEIVHHHKIDSFTFEESKHLNAHINYRDYHEAKTRYQRCYVLQGNPLSIYSDSIKSEAIIPLYAEKPQEIELIARDFHNNSSILKFWLKREKNMKPPPPLHYNYILDEGEAHLIKLDSNIVFFSDSSLYQKEYINLSLSSEIHPPLASKELFLNTQKNIFKHKIDLYINKDHLPDSLLNKATIVECTKDALVSYGGYEFEDFITTKIDKFGNYAIFIDTIPPAIELDYFSPDMRNKDYFSFKIHDNIEPAGMARDIRYNGYIDEKWVLFEYDAKTKQIRHIFEDDQTKGNHQLKIELIDDKENITIFIKNFKL